MPHAGIQAEKVAGTRAYDEGKTAVLAGLAAGAGLLLSQVHSSYGATGILRLTDHRGR